MVLKHRRKFACWGKVDPSLFYQINKALNTKLVISYFFEAPSSNVGTIQYHDIPHMCYVHSNGSQIDDFLFSTKVCIILRFDNSFFEIHTFHHFIFIVLPVVYTSRVQRNTPARCTLQLSSKSSLERMTRSTPADWLSPRRDPFWRSISLIEIN